MEPWGGFVLRSLCLVYGFVVALRWLCPLESPRSLCLVYGFVVALGGLSPLFLLSTFCFLLCQSVAMGGFGWLDTFGSR